MKMSIRVLFIYIVIICSQPSIAQSSEEDTLTNKNLDSVIVGTYINNAKIKYLPNIVDMNIYAGKKTNVVYPDPSRANLAQNITRTAFAKIPGLTMWDMDGAGLQIN